jgi:hypothetical protein
MTQFTSILANTSTIAGFSAALVSIGGVVTTWRAARAQTRLLNEVSEKRALESTDIDVLGGYLYENVGKARISSYVHDTELRGRVTRALEAITEFLGAEPTPEPGADAPAQGPEPTTAELPESLSATVRGELSKSLNDIRFGEVWNGLARIRRLIEQQLRELNPEPQPNRPISIGRMLGSLARAGIISPGVEELLSYAIKVSNAGVHGQEVDAALALTRLWLRMPGSTQCKAWRS